MNIDFKFRNKEQEMAKTGNYIAHSMPYHPKANKSGMVLEHILIAERALGRYLPKGTIVHHHDGNGRNNKNTNLVICQDQKYHQLLHIRMRILKIGGDPDLHKICSTCSIMKLKALFNSNRSNHDGLAPSCAACANKIRRNYPQYR